MGLIYIYSNTPPAVWTTVAAESDWTPGKENTYEPLPQTQLTTGDVEAGVEGGEGRRREALGEDVGELGGGRYVKDPHLTDGNPITDEV
jgi:hypothetical protein